MNSCSACKFWDDVVRERVAKASSDAGLCRRALPTLRPDAFAVWPQTRPGDWCGEYKPESTVTPIGPAPGGTPLALRRVG